MNDDTVTIADVVPLVLMLERIHGYALHFMDKAGVIRSWKVGRMRMYSRDDLESVGLDTSHIAESRPIRISSLMSRKEASEYLGISTTWLWQNSDYQGGTIKTVAFNEEPGCRMWLKESLDEYKHRQRQ